MATNTSTAQTEYKKLQVVKLDTNFRVATTLVTAKLPALKKNQVLIRNCWAGINASDVNWTAGRYYPGMRPPFDCGFEAVGVVEAVGEGVAHLRAGQAVLHSAPGAFSELQALPASLVLPIPTVDAKYLPLRVNALTAFAALDLKARPKKGELALVTAAAGGTGQFAVQLLKQHYGCHVIGTCSGADKVAFLKSIGCDRAVDYKSERLDEVLRKEYSGKGLDVVFESVGGDMFETALRHLAQGGRLLTIGAIEGYLGSADSAEKRSKRAPNQLNMILISRSASIHGFLLTHLSQEKTAYYMGQLIRMVQDGRLSSAIDPRSFEGLTSVPDAVEYLHTGRSIGKVAVRISPPDLTRSKL